jgi:hypothetical protein
MKVETVVEDISALPPGKQEEVADFVAFLRSRWEREQTPADARPEPRSFVGMWADRADMSEGTSWVRRLRETEWISGNA